MLPGGSGLRWLATLSTVLSLVACYGTLAIVALLGVLGTAVAINETLWAGAIVAFAALALAGLGLGFARHRQSWPLLVGGIGAAAIVYVQYVQYDSLIEVAGFVLLGVGAIWDWRICRVPAAKGQAAK
jgi:MerC mercury resistance protein